MRVFVCRHGNTFGPDQVGGEKVYFCGSNNNIPLVVKGREQARAMGHYLQQRNITPTAIYANHLIRVWEFASLIKEQYWQTEVNVPLIPDEGLLELDYGVWAGLTTNEVVEKFGTEAINAWQQQRITQNKPPHNWQMSSELIIANIKELFSRLVAQYSASDTILLIGSQGSITFLNVLFEGGMVQALAEDRYKVKTGRFAELEFLDGHWVLRGWNQDPNCVKMAPH